MPIFLLSPLNKSLLCISVFPPSVKLIYQYLDTSGKCSRKSELYKYFPVSEVVLQALIQIFTEPVSAKYSTLDFHPLSNSIAMRTETYLSPLTYHSGFSNAPAGIAVIVSLCSALVLTQGFFAGSSAHGGRAQFSTEELLHRRSFLRIETIINISH